MSETPYILEKDGTFYSFPSEGAACAFLGVPKCCVASAYRHGGIYHGYRVIKPVSEKDIYRNKRLHKIWESMLDRCEYKKHKRYYNYGGRGIVVCDEWHEYIPFARWAKLNGYTDSLTLDRIDNNGNYDPDNCRWVTMLEQQNNKRVNRHAEYNGKEYTVAQLARMAGIGTTTMAQRLSYGWSVEEAMKRPVAHRTKKRLHEDRREEENA